MNRHEKTGAGTGAPQPSTPARDAVIALDLPAAPLDAGAQAYFAKCEEKLGFVPNVLKAYSFDLAKLKAFIAMSDDLMLAPSGLSKLEREMIAVTVSSANHCHYCLVAHAAAVRKYSGNPQLAETIAANYRAADLDARTRAMLDFAWKITVEPWGIEEADRAALREAGFSDREIWDIAAVAGFFNLSNRVASATDMRPNEEYYSLAR
ncbi:MAG TPA: peroxidase-related enzyme [Xanthobacteraceae bacterium]|nr:peroxidase-related enzyme [Xanthobacteraceae bacterium]